MKSNTILFFIILFIGICIISYSRLLEIYKPVKQISTKWKQVFDLSKINNNYVAQGIENYKNYLFLTVHKKDKGSVLIVFKINVNNSLIYVFQADFPKEATHISDLSICKNYLYAIDYTSNNLYKIDIEKTLEKQSLIITNIVYTNLKRSGSIIVTNYKNRNIIYITQFLLNNYIKVFYLNDLGKKDKKEIFKIKSKYFIQGLYKNNDQILVSSNAYGKDTIFITNETELLKTQKLNNKTTIPLEGPNRMIEDVVLYNGYIFTSDEETNKIYVTQKKLVTIND